MTRRTLISGLIAGTAVRIPLLAQAKALRLKITGLKTFNIDGAGVFVKILTDQGLTGLGEGTVKSKESTIAQAILEQERFLAGQNPADIEFLYQSMFRNPRWRGGPVLNSAISAVEMALWDIAGKSLGVPIYQLLGGAARRRIRLYKDVGSNPEAFEQAKSEGYTAAKSGFITVKDNVVVPGLAVREAARKVAAVRKAVGEEFDIAIDAHGQLTTVMAVDFCTRIEELDPLFVEEATQLEDIDELALLRSKTRVPLATGERSFTRYGFAPFCVRHLVNYIQPDVCHAGGILELKKIGALAETFRIEMAPHNPQGPVSTLASLHVNATTPAATLLEYAPNRAPWETDLFRGAAIHVKDGYADLPDRPGLGVDLDEAVAARHPYKPVNRPAYRFRDGSVADY